MTAGMGNKKYFSIFEAITDLGLLAYWLGEPTDASRTFYPNQARRTLPHPVGLDK